MMDDDTYEALNIVHARHHPSLFKCGDVAAKKQSGSLFILLNRCQSRPGVQFLWQVAPQFFFYLTVTTLFGGDWILQENSAASHSKRGGS